MLGRLIGLLLCGLLTGTAAASRVESTPCPTGFAGASGVECFYLPLDGTRLFFTRLSGGDGPPVLLVPGGPGVAPSDSGRAWLERLAPWRKSRPVILLDLRGTGLSGPDLACPEQPPSGPLRADRVAQCRQRLAANGPLPIIDSRQLAGDIMALRQALGIRQWLLYGVSHGTRIALVTAALDPAGTAALVLDSLRPPWRPFYTARLAQQRDALAVELAAECKAQRACARDYPQLGATLHQILSGTDDGDGASEQRLMLIALMSNPDTRSLVPYIASRWRRGNDPALAAALATLSRPATVSLGHHLSLVCAEDVPTQTGAEAYLLQYRAACAAWMGNSPASVGPPLLPPMALPVLILAGLQDALTPFDRAEIAQHLPAATLLPVAGAGHDVLGRSACANEALLRFLRDPAATPGDCSQDTSPTPFASPARARQRLGMPKQEKEKVK
jgi:pimeloyl-ACP methyl ester carboxylesterase